MFVHTVKRFTWAAAAVTALVASAPAAAGPYSSLFIFGDSLSDTGNLFNLTKSVTGTGVPGAPYFDGQFSNGKLAAEYLAEGLGLSGAAVQNLAYAGARTGANGQVAGTGLRSQINGFASAVGGTGTDPTGLYYVWAGANDLRDAAFAGTFQAAFGGIASNLVYAVSTLYGLGARDFLLPNIPDLGLTPEGLASGAGGLLSGFAQGFNGFMAGNYAALLATLPDADFHYLDAMGAQRALIGGAPGNGFTNVTNGCLIPVAGAPAGSTDCASSVYVDGIHPTTAVHAILGQQMLVAVVPEPASMLLTGTAILALLGMSRRRRA